VTDRISGSVGRRMCVPHIRRSLGPGFGFCRDRDFVGSISPRVPCPWLGCLHESHSRVNRPSPNLLILPPWKFSIAVATATETRILASSKRTHRQLDRNIPPPTPLSEPCIQEIRMKSNILLLRSRCSIRGPPSHCNNRGRGKSEWRLKTFKSVPRAPHQR
jgi:hypothetical protein